MIMKKSRSSRVILAYPDWPYPAVAEPRIVRILSGAAVVEERELGGRWLKTRVERGNFFLTTS
jgi:hypothetical protein